MKKTVLLLIGLTAILSLSACGQQQDSTELKTTQHIAAANQASNRASSAKAADATAKQTNGRTWQAANDHIVSAETAAVAVKQAVKSASKLKIVPIPEANVDSHGHHYYQVDTFSKNQHATPVTTYFVYPDGQITTRQTD